ncbi:integrin alpha-D-like [Opisthocomus hoazin]|uniref:integrin alpha-D-like n=1 Tax=Opisthocomus hoazin TaxID=30419 RepID=UPI003F5372E8
MDPTQDFNQHWGALVVPTDWVDFPPFEVSFIRFGPISPSLGPYFLTLVSVLPVLCRFLPVLGCFTKFGVYFAHFGAGIPHFGAISCRIGFTLSLRKPLRFGISHLGTPGTGPRDGPQPPRVARGPPHPCSPGIRGAAAGTPASGAPYVWVRALAAPAINKPDRFLPPMAPPPPSLSLLFPDTPGWPPCTHGCCSRCSAQGCPLPLAPDWTRRRQRFFWGAGGSFGHSVAQADGGVLVGAPLEPGAGGGTGRVYRCPVGTGRCQDVPITVPPEVTSVSLGLSLVAHGSQLLACGPTAQRACGVNMELRGLCVLLPAGSALPATLPGCPMKASDIVFLVDGSGSIGGSDFRRMKTFITQVMNRFESTDTRFALMEYSSSRTLQFDFATFARLSAAERAEKVNGVRQSSGTTWTASAIQTVVRQLFAPGKGARGGAHRILIVVTDGQKYRDPLEYRDVIPEAARAGIIRYAIGVGSAFQDQAAMEELHSIASEPSKDHVFRVDNFDALQGIQNQLQEKIFAIEGTQSAHSSSFQLEMAQEGFSALLTPEGPVLGAVGAYGWSGGAFVHGGSGDTTFVNVSRDAGDMDDAYLGYAAESLSLEGGRAAALALGAPRYRHVGRLLLFHRRGPRAAWELLADAAGPQVGSYFGASLCALDADGDGAAEALLVGAPMFYGAGSGGRVAVCALRPKGGRLRCQQTLRGQPGHPLGRFGASLARLGDVDGDRWPEVAVGAPLEDEERGAVYIFRGKQGGVASPYSQRISGAWFSSGPRYFGQAISGGQDLTGDRLPDVAVGAQGQVLLLRSQPLLRVRVTVTFQPQEIPAAAFDCQEEEAHKGEVAKAMICFLSTKKTPDNFGSQLSATLRYQAALDPGRAMVRAVFAGSSAVRNGTLRVGVGQSCETLAIVFTGCPQDTLSPLVLRLTYDAVGDPISVAGGLRPALSEDSEMVAIGALPFEKNCGADNVCVDDLRISLSFSGLETIVVGVTDVVDITVTLRNHGEDSYGTTVQLQHAEALSYRKAVVLQLQVCVDAQIHSRCPQDPPENQKTSSAHSRRPLDPPKPLQPPKPSPEILKTPKPPPDVLKTPQAFLCPPKALAGNPQALQKSMCSLKLSQVSSRPSRPPIWPPK